MVAQAVCQQVFATKAVATRPSRSRVVRVAAVQQQEAAPAPLRFLAAGLAAAAVATCGSPAEAGVVLVQPEVKNFVKNTTPAPKAESSSSGSKAAAADLGKKAKAEAAPKAKKSEEASAPGAGFEAFRPFAFPLSLLLVGGAGAAAVKADPEFARLLDETWSAKDSISTGAGYETAPGLKDTPFYGGSNTNGAAPKKAGTAKKAAGTGAKKAAGTGTLKKFFG